MSFGFKCVPLFGLLLLALAATLICAQRRTVALPRFEDYPVQEHFTGVAAAPKLATPLEQRYATEIKGGVENGDGVMRDCKEQKGPNFARHLIVIQWGCGSPCMRMAIVDARTGDVYYPPISINGLGARSFDLPVLTVGRSVPQNPEVQFHLNSNLMIIRANPGHSDRAYAYYFLWGQGRWKLLRRVALH